jgi:hypothetical protein
MICPMCPGRCAAAGVPQAPMVTALNCCYAPGATVGMRSGWHPVAGKRRPFMPVTGAFLVEFPSAQFAAHCLSTHRWPSGWHCEQVWAGQRAYRHHGTGTRRATWHNWHSGYGQHGTATTPAGTGISKDRIRDEVLQTNRLRQACSLSRPLYIPLQEVA